MPTQEVATDGMDPALVDGVLGDILARPEFQPPSPAPLWRVLGAVGDWIWARLGDLLVWLAPGLEAASPVGSVLARFALVLLGVVGVGVLVYLARLWLAGLRGGPAGRRRGPAMEGEEVRTADEWEERARSAAAEERWREAMTALYQAVIHRLAEDGRVGLDPGKTPGDYRRELRSDPRAAPLLDRFVRRWEPVAFGRRSAERRGWHELLEVARALGACRG